MIAHKSKILQTRHKDYQQIYTNGSKEDSNVVLAFLPDSNCNIQHFADGSSIFTAETKAVDVALDFMRTCDINNIFITFSNSLSVLKVMNFTRSKDPQIQKLLEKCHKLLVNSDFVFC